LRSEKITDQGLALHHLHQLGKIAAAAIEDVKPLTADRDGDLFALAAKTLARIGEPGAMVDLAIEEVESGEFDRRESGFEIILDIGPGAEKALPLLRRLHRTGDDRLTSRAAGAINAITGEDIYGKGGSRMSPSR